MGQQQLEFGRKQLFNLGDRLRQMRKDKGYESAEKFANEHGFNRVQYGRYENGANISFLTLMKIIKALNISVKDFFAEGFEADEQGTGQS